MATTKKVISTAEAARIIGCHVTLVRKMLADGRLAGERLGKVWMVELGAARAVQPQVGCGWRRGVKRGRK